MQQRLPQISIKVDVPPEQFVRRMESVANQSGEYVTRLDLIEQQGQPVHRLRLEPLIVTVQTKLCGWIVTVPGMNDRVCMELTAAPWRPEPPDYDAYAAAAQEVFADLVHQYNHAYRSTRRLTIQSRADTDPQLPPVAGEYYEGFVSGADRKALLEIDWLQLYPFIIHCATYNIDVTADELAWLLERDGFEAGHAADVAAIFDLGRRIMWRKWRGNPQGGPQLGEGE